MRVEFINRIRSSTAKEALFLHTGGFGSMLELKDGRLLNISGGFRSLSSDGGDNFSEPEELRDGEGDLLSAGNPNLLRLKSGRIGVAFDKSDGGRYGMGVWFSRSEDEGMSWSKPVKVSEPHNNAWVYWDASTVASSGRILVPVYVVIGKTMREKGRSFFGDETVLIGHHGYENSFGYCTVYYSDDEGENWQPNDKFGYWASGGELFITLDDGAGGHFRCVEPVVEEVSPGHLLLILRSPLGRLYQSWSHDNGANWSLPEPTALASSTAPAALKRVPGSDDLLIIWNQTSTDEIQRGRQRHRLSAALSRDGGCTWKHGRNVFFIEKESVTCIEPPPIRYYRTQERSPRVPLNDLEGTYPAVTFWNDRVIVVFRCKERSRFVIDEATQWIAGKGEGTSVCLGLPLTWFYKFTVE